MREKRLHMFMGSVGPVMRLACLDVNAEMHKGSVYKTTLDWDDVTCLRCNKKRLIYLMGKRAYVSMQDFMKTFRNLTRDQKMIYRESLESK